MLEMCLCCKGTCTKNLPRVKKTLIMHALNTVSTYRIGPFGSDCFCNLLSLFSRLWSSLATFCPRHCFPPFNTLQPLLLKLFIQDVIRIPLQLFLTSKAPSSSFSDQVLPLEIATFLHHQLSSAFFPPHTHPNPNFLLSLFTVRTLRIE